MRASTRKWFKRAEFALSLTKGGRTKEAELYRTHFQRRPKMERAILQVITDQRLKAEAARAAAVARAESRKLRRPRAVKRAAR